MRPIFRQGNPADPAAQPRDGSEALAWLDAGNDRFSRLAAAARQPDTGIQASFVLEGDFGVGALLERQHHPHPFGIVLGCADASLPIEVVFGRTADDLFVVKLAGNTIGSDALASIEYAVERFPTIQVAVVLGHTLCGAVAAAVETFLKRRFVADLAISLPLRALVDRMYDLATGRVCDGANAPAPFATSPDDAEGFRSLARTLAGSGRVRRLLQDLHT